MNHMVKRNNGINRMQTLMWNSNGHKALDGYQLLAIEIVRVAAEDYRRELIISKKEKLKTRECYRLERFFRSEYGQLLSMGTGDYIMRRIQKEVENTK